MHDEKLFQVLLVFAVENTGNFSSEEGARRILMNTRAKQTERAKRIRIEWINVSSVLDVAITYEAILRDSSRTFSLTFLHPTQFRLVLGAHRAVHVYD